MPFLPSHPMSYFYIPPPKPPQSVKDTKKEKTSSPEKKLIDYVFEGNTAEVQRALEAGANANQETSAGLTALMLAAHRDHPDIARLLIEAGADINTRSTYEWTAAELATGKPEIEKLLAKAQAWARQTALERTLPDPEVTALEADLKQIVEKNSVEEARKFFDKLFFEGKTISATWEHLQIALTKEDKPMIRLLVKWGAHATEEDVARLSAAQGSRPYIRLLRQCGLRIANTPGASAPDVAEVIAPEKKDMLIKGLANLSFTDALTLTANSIPDEWKKVLSTCQKNDAPEAVIAGGALRDLFNKKSIHDVDIFLKTRGSTAKNRKMVEKIFADADLTLAKYYPCYSYGALPSELPGPQPMNGIEGLSGKKWLGKDKLAENWTVLAGPQKTEYNIIFVEGDLTQKKPADFAPSLIECFDFGICQIAFNGKSMVTTDAFKRDIESNAVSQQRSTTPARIDRIKEKYPERLILTKESSQKIRKHRTSPTKSWDGYSDWTGYR